MMHAPATACSRPGGGVLRRLAPSGAASGGCAARRAVILACGGFEADREMQRQYWQADPVLGGSFLGNTGDGIRMAQALGADLWHMWHFHGSYGLQAPRPDLPLRAPPQGCADVDARAARLASGLGVETSGDAAASGKMLAELAWILVDQTGRRFMDEYPPYPGDSGHRPFDHYDFKTQRFPRNPAFMVFDEEGRKMYPLGRAVHNDPHPRHEWTRDNLREIEAGIFEKADTLEELAERMGVPAGELRETVDRWNRHVAAGTDPDHGRRPETMKPVATPPFYFGRVHPVVINTQGGPRHNVHQQVLDPFGEPIPGLYAAGELGSVFGHVYMSGGNLAECLVGGRTAARHAAALPRGVTGAEGLREGAA